MPFNKITALLIILSFSVPATINAQCEDDVNLTISVDDFPIELSGSTTASGDDFVVYSSGTTDIFKTPNCSPLRIANIRCDLHLFNGSE